MSDYPTGRDRFFDAHINDIIRLGSNVRVRADGTNEWGRVVRVRVSTYPGWEGYGWEYQFAGDDSWWLTGPDGVVQACEKAT